MSSRSRTLTMIIMGVMLLLFAIVASNNLIQNKKLIKENEEIQEVLETRDEFITEYKRLLEDKQTVIVQYFKIYDTWDEKKFDTYFKTTYATQYNRLKQLEELLNEDYIKKN